MNKISIGIKTFCRPHCLNHCLQRFINSEKYIGIPVIIADDSEEQLKKKNKDIIEYYKSLNNKINIKYIDLSFNSGLSMGRNKIVENCDTNYTLIMDESRTISRNTPLFEMVNFLEDTNYDLIAGIIKGRKGYNGLFENIRETNKFKIIDIKESNINIENNYFKAYKTNIALNVFVARTSMLRKNKWIESRKMGEHSLFFLDLYKNKIKCAISNEIIFEKVKKKFRKYGKFTKYRTKINFNFTDGIKNIKYNYI